MDLGILKKKLSSYKTDGGYVKNVSGDLLIEILSARESWTGPSAGFYSGLGINGKSGAKMIGEAKKLKREGFAKDGFKEVKVSGGEAMPGGPCQGVTSTLSRLRLCGYFLYDQKSRNGNHATRPFEVTFGALNSI